MIGNHELAAALWGGKTELSFEDLGDNYGKYNHETDAGTIIVNQRYNTNDAEDVAVGAAIASHEAQHLYDRMNGGETTEYNAHVAGGTTYLRLMDQLGLEGNDRMMQSIVAALMSEQSKQANVGATDHWRMTADGGLEFTGEGWLRTADDQFYINSDGSRTPVSEGPIPGLTIGAEGIETGLLNILNDGGTSGQSYDSFSDEQKQAAQQLMIGAGLGYVLRGDGTATLANRFWDENTVNGQTIGASMLEGYDLPGGSNSGLLNGRLHRLFAGMGFGSVTERVAEIGNGLEQNASSLWDRIAAPRQQDRPGLFGRINNAWDRLWGRQPDDANDQYANAMRVADSQAETLQFWQSVMNPAVAEEYRDTAAIGPQCNRFVCDTLRSQFGQEVLDYVFPNGQQYANLMALELEANENVVRLDVSNDEDLRHIQSLANEGYLVLMAYQNPNWVEGTSPAFGDDLSGHLAFVAPETLDLFHLARAGRDTSWADDRFGNRNGTQINFGDDGPIMIQAGSYTGVTPMRLSTNNWANSDYRNDVLLPEFVNFYLVQGQ